MYKNQQEFQILIMFGVFYLWNWRKYFNNELQSLFSVCLGNDRRIHHGEWT